MVRKTNLVGIAAALLLGCATLQGRGEKLREAIFAFNEGVRWGQIEEVLARVDPQSEAHFLDMHKDFGKSIQITDCEIVRTDVDIENGRAEVGIKITWYRIDEMIVYETALVQFWEEKERDWMMMREEYRSGTPF